MQTWVNSNKTLLQTTIDERDQLDEWLGGNITNYESQIDSLDSQIATRNSQINSLDAQITSLQSEIDTLEAPQLHLVNYEATVHTVWLGTDYVTVEGTIFNSGSNSATNVILTVRVYDSGMTLIETEQLAFVTIIGKSYKDFDTSISAEGAYYTTKQLTYD